MIMKRFCIKECIRFILILSVCGFTMSCSGDKSAEMQEEIAAAYNTAAENINNATDTESAVRISEQLQTTLSGIQAKYKDVTDNMPEEQKQRKRIWQKTYRSCYNRKRQCFWCSGFICFKNFECFGESNTRHCYFCKKRSNRDC